MVFLEKKNGIFLGFPARLHRGAPALHAVHVPSPGGLGALPIPAAKEGDAPEDHEEGIERQIPQ